MEDGWGQIIINQVERSLANGVSW